MAQSIYDMVTSEAIAAYYETLYSNEIPMIGETLFPNRKKQGLRLEWIKGYDSLPVALNPSAFDAASNRQKCRFSERLCELANMIDSNFLCLWNLIKILMQEKS